MGTVRLTVAQAVVLYLSGQYSVLDGHRRRLIPAMLGIFGHGNVAGLGQALNECGATLPYLQGRNEQSMVHTAVGYAKAMRRTATLAVTASIGPGSTNMITGAALATVNRLPVLLFPSDTYVTRRQGPVLQQLESPGAADVSVNDCFRPVARFFDRITRPEQLLTALPQAMRVLANPAETGAVVISLPQDVQPMAYEYPERFFAETEWRIGRRAADPDDIATVADMLAQAERPIIIAGGGVVYSGAEAALTEFAGEYGIPVTETFAGKGAVQRPEWWHLGGIGLEGNPAANAAAAEADLVLHVGTRLTDFATASQSLFACPEVRFAGINVTEYDAVKQGAVPILADAMSALRDLHKAAQVAGVRCGDDWRRRITGLRDTWAVQRAAALQGAPGGRMTQARLIGVLQEETGLQDTVVAAAGGPPGDLLKVWDCTSSAKCHIEFGFSCMGYELPASLGVRLAQDDGEVIAFIGDGTFLMQPTELVTAVQENLKITLVISENHGFQVIHRLQRMRGGEPFGNEFRYRTGDRVTTRLDGAYIPLDLASVARGLGAMTFTAETPEQVREALRDARANDGVSVVVVEVAPHADLPPAGVWWDVAPAEASRSAEVQRQRHDYEVGLQSQRWFG